MNADNLNPSASIRVIRGKFGRLILPFLLALLALGARAAEVLPPAPTAYFNDYAGIVAPAAARQLDAELSQFERDTSSQIVVAIYPRMQSDSSVEDYTVRLAQKWAVGQKDKKNGAVLFLFQESHDIRIVTGYGLEGALPDALCKRIIEDEIIPRFRQGDFTGGVTAGVHAMLAATKGKYHGTGRTAGDRQGQPMNPFAMLAIVMIIIAFSIARRGSGTVYSRSGRSTPWIGTGGGWGGGGGGGGGFSGGGGSFGGGSFGGGGAGGKW